MRSQLFPECRTSDVLSGTGISRGARSARLNGCSIVGESAFQYRISARLTTQLVGAQVATKGTGWFLDSVSSPQWRGFLMSAVLPGTGTTRFVCRVLTDTSLTPTGNAPQSATTARLTTRLACAPHAMGATSSTGAGARWVIPCARIQTSLEHAQPVIKATSSTKATVYHCRNWPILRSTTPCAALRSWRSLTCRWVHATTSD